MALRWTQPLTETNTGNLPEGEVQLVHEAETLTAICDPVVSKNTGTLTSLNPVGLHSLL
jgi:hypothetical protein